MTRLFRLSAAALLAAALAAFPAAPAAAAQGSTLIIVPKKSNPNQLISFSFQQAPIDDVLRFLADASGKTVFKDATVEASVTIRNQSRIRVADAVKLVQTFLALKGFALAETEDAIVVTPSAVARQRGNAPISTGKSLEAIPRGKQIITHIFPLTTVDAVRLREELQPLFPAGSGIFIVNAETNSLIVIDEADNVRRVAEIINLVDKGLTDQIAVEIIRLKFADAAEVSQYLTELFRADDTTRAPRPQGEGGMAPAAAQSGLAALRGRVRFAADRRSNSVIVHATPANIESVRRIIEQIDVNIAPRTEFRIVELRYADAVGLADQLNQLLDPTNRTGNRGFFGGFGGGGASTNNQDRGLQDYRVVADVRTNSLIITAPLDQMEGLVELVRKLDVPSQVESVVRVFQLKNAIASDVANSLRTLFQGNQQGGGFGFNLFGGGGRGQVPPNSPLDLLRQVTIVPNDQTNQLLVSGPAQTFEVIEQLISETAGLDRRLPQVFIEVVIADVTLDDETKFGIEWNAISGTSVGGTNFGLTSPTADPTGFRYSVLSDNIQATLQALRTTDKIKIISTPHVMVTDNSPALISIGERIPYAGETTITNGVAQSSVDFQDVAITLNVTPHISPGNHILMDVDQVVNSLIGFINVGPNQVAPRTTSRRAGTTVIVEDSQTVVLGGIISNDEQKRVQKVPILGDIPFLGQLFRNTVKAKGRTELVVFLTPHVVRNPGDADKIVGYERQRLDVDPLKAPFLSKPLDLNYLRPENVFPRKPDYVPAQPLVPEEPSMKPQGTPQEK